MAHNKDLVADVQTLLEENLSEKKSVESARRLPFPCTKREFALLVSYKFCGFCCFELLIETIAIVCNR